MTRRRNMWVEPNGRQYALQLLTKSADEVRVDAIARGEEELFDLAHAMHRKEPVPAFLHSALCAMSLPTRRPTGDDEFKPIIRQDRNYSLAITPKPRLVRQPDGQVELVNLGVPFGSYPRIILIHILSQAVRKQTRNIYLGGSFRDMMRRFGYEGASRGQRGQTDLLREQLDRLLACEWMIHWAHEDAATLESAFKVNEVKLSHDYSGLNSPDGSFNRELRLSETFYEHLRDHAVRFDMNAVHALRRKPTAIDLYSYLSYRLPRIPQGKTVELDYEQLGAHIGNNIADKAKLRQTIKRTLEVVATVYGHAQIDMGAYKVKLQRSSPPVADAVRVVSTGIPDAQSKGTREQIPPATTLRAVEPLLELPEGNIRFAHGAEVFRQIIKRNTPADQQMVIDAYRTFIRSKGQSLPTGDRLLKSFEGFCRSYRMPGDRLL
jgi:hypothetical protein